MSTEPNIDEVLTGFLRKPRSRGALEAMASEQAFPKQYVASWLINEVREGRVIKHKSAEGNLYSVDLGYVREEPEPSEYPDWLDPRSLPVTRTRTLYVGGVATRKGK